MRTIHGTAAAGRLDQAILSRLLKKIIVNSTPIKNEPGVVLGVLLIALLVGLLISVLATGFHTGPLRPGINTVLLGIYIMAWGAMFLASYFYSHKTFFFRALIWVCENWSHPKGRRMALFYAAIAILFGCVSILSGFGIVGAAA